MPFLVMPDGRKVIATHVLKFPLKRETSDLAYDSVTNQFITCFDKGIPQLATFRLSDSIIDLRQLTIAGDTTYYDLEGVAVQRSDSLGIRLKLCGERVLRDSLPILTLRCNTDSCWHDSALTLTVQIQSGVNTNWEGIALFDNWTHLAKERERSFIVSSHGFHDGFEEANYGNLIATDTSQSRMIEFTRSFPDFSQAGNNRIIGSFRLAFSAITIDTVNYLLYAINRPGRTVEFYQVEGSHVSYFLRARYELVDHPLEWTGTDTGDLLYGLVEGIAIGPVNGQRSLVMITDPGFGNYPKIVVFPWTYTYPDRQPPEN